MKARALVEFEWDTTMEPPSVPGIREHMKEHLTDCWAIPTISLLDVEEVIDDE